MSKAEAIVVMTVSSSGPDNISVRERGREYNSTGVNNNGSADSEPHVER